MSKSSSTASERSPVPRMRSALFFILFGVALGALASQNFDLAAISSKMYESTQLSCAPPLSINSTSAAYDEFQLARDESYGFFQDIKESEWKLSQELHARIFPNHFGRMMEFANGPNDKGNYQALKKSNWWNSQNFQVEFHCRHMVRIPDTGEGDGPKWVCDPHRLNQRKDCLIYSVGSNGNVMFERGVKDYMPNCEIHTFDVIDSRKIRGEWVKFEDVLKPYSTFHHWGIGPKDEKNVKTLASTMEALGHENRSIDIFKIDCEWCEWFTFESWLEAGFLRQILVETHNAPMPHAKHFFYTLHDNGYVIFSKEANYPNGAGGVEFGFLKLKTSFFKNGTMYKLHKG